MPDLWHDPRLEVPFAWGDRVCLPLQSVNDDRAFRIASLCVPCRRGRLWVISTLSIRAAFKKRCNSSENRVGDPDFGKLELSHFARTRRCRPLNQFLSS